MFHHFISREHSMGIIQSFAIQHTYFFCIWLLETFWFFFVCFDFSVRIKIAMVCTSVNRMMLFLTTTTTNVRIDTECSWMCTCHILMVFNDSSSSSSNDNNNSSEETNSICIHYMRVFLEVWWQHPISLICYLKLWQHNHFIRESFFVMQMQHNTDTNTTIPHHW